MTTDGADIPPPPQSMRGEADVAHEDAPDPLANELGGPSDEAGAGERPSDPEERDVRR